MMGCQSKIKAFLSRFIPDKELQEDEDIFALGYVNSLFAMQLVLFVEKEFNIAIDNKDLDLENFKTIDAMARLIEGKKTSENSAILG